MSTVTTTYDPMHFEVVPRPSQAERAMMAKLPITSHPDAWVLITHEQRKMLFGMLHDAASFERNVLDREARLAFTSEVLGRHVVTWSYLGNSDVEKLVAAFQAVKAWRELLS